MKTEHWELNHFIKMVKEHKNVVVGKLTSASLYSIYLNKFTKFYRVNKISRTYFQEVVEDEYEFYPQFKDLIDEKVLFKNKKKLVEDILGVKFKKKKEDLAEILGWKNSYKKYMAKLVYNSKKILNIY